MPSTMLLDQTTWDLVLDANGNIALASEPYSLAQDAASAIRTFLGECYWDTTVGVPYLSQILGKAPSIEVLKAQMVTAAETVPGVATAVCFISDVQDRCVTGQVQVVSEGTGQASAAPFTVTIPQGTA